jgi:Amt family ammonium transporter
MGLLWFGWLGFNGGSALAANGLAASAFTTTFAAAAAAGLCWSLFELFQHGRVTGVGLASGAVAGLVGITPASGYVTPMAALVIGALAAGASYAAVRIRPKIGVDDSLDVFSVHGVAGILGSLLTGVFATTLVNSGGADGVLAAGNWKLLGVQAIGVLASLAWSGGASFVILKVIDKVIGLRTDAADEAEGLDTAENGERAYGELDIAPHIVTGAPVASAPAAAPVAEPVVAQQQQQ